MRVIVATDFGPSPSTVLLETLAWPPESELEVVHVAQSMSGREGTVGERGDLGHVLAAGLREALWSARVRSATLAGDIVEELLRRATDVHADLVVVGAPRRRVWCQRRSVVARLVGRTPCALLIARTDHIGRLLLADDGTPAADGAAGLIERSTLLAGIPVTIVRALDLDSTIPTPRRTSFFQEPPEYTEARNAARARLEERVARLARGGRSAFGIVRGGQTQDEVLCVARALRVDAVVVGTPIPAGGRPVSLVRGIALEADCSVLIAPGSVMGVEDVEVTS